MRAPEQACRAVCLLLAVPALARGDEPVVKVGGLVDLRYAHTDTQRSWLDGGVGKLRYGAGVAGRADLLRLGQLSLLVDAEPSPVFSAHVQLNVDAEPDEAGLRSRADLVEAFMLYRPELSPTIRLHLRGGAFFPPVSLEHTGPAWTTPYTITPSAANSWIGEEVRTIGVEGTMVLKWDEDEVRLTGAGYGSNDPAGTLLGWRGWALHDRQTGFGDRLAYAPVPGMSAGGPFARNARWAEPMVEVDGRIGWYAGAALRRAGRFEARALRLDNRGDPTVFDGWQYAWRTRFSAFGLRLELSGKIQLLGQHMQGETDMGPTPGGDAAVVVPFRTTYGLVSIPVRRHRLSVRYERFRAEDDDVLQDLDPNAEDGRAWTACYAFEPTERQRIALEVVRVEADRTVRPLLGHPVRSEETLVQASWRVSF
jgi:hypothetical protein